MTKKQKFVPIVKEMEKDRKNKLGVSAIIDCSDAEKVDDRVIVDDILQKHW